MRTVVVNINKESFDVYIGRAGRGQDGYFGNPFRIGHEINREDAVQKFQSTSPRGLEKTLNSKGGYSR